MPNTFKLDAVIVQCVVREYDAEGAPVREIVLPASKVFRRAETEQFWDTATREVEQAMQSTPKR